jgi:hypothetical protein
MQKTKTKAKISPMSLNDKHILPAPAEGPGQKVKGLGWPQVERPPDFLKGDADVPVGHVSITQAQ